MRNRLLILLVSLLVGAGGAVYGQSISLDHVDGLVEGNFPIDAQAVFYLRMATGTTNPAGITNGYRIYSPEGATWTGATLDSTGTITASMMESQFMTSYSTGSDADTLGYGGFRMFNPGIPAGFDEIYARITVGPISSADEGKTLCLDSSWYRPSGIWKWASTSADIFPTWDGPHCYNIGSTPPANLVVAPDTLYFSGIEGAGSPLPQTFNVSFDDDGAYAFTASETADYMSLDAASGTTPLDVTVTIDIAGLTEGVYLDSVTISSEDAGNGDQYAYIELTIDSQPTPLTLVVTPDTLRFSGQIGSSDPDGQYLYINEIEHREMPYGVMESTDWLSLEKDLGTTEDSVLVTVTQDGLSADVYYALITVTDNVAKTDIPVTVVFELAAAPNNAPVLSVLDSAFVCADSVLILPMTATDADEDALTFTVSPLADGMTFVDSGNGAGYIQFVPTMDQVGDVWTWAYVSDGKDIDSNDVHFIVQDCTPPCSEMALSNTDFYFAMYEGDANPVAQLLDITSSDASFGWEIIKSGGDWLTIDPLSGLSGSQVTLTVDGSSLSAGNYEVTFAVAADPEVVCDPATQYVTVYFDVIVPPSDEDFVTVTTIPAVPGARVKMPVKIEHVCDLGALSVTLAPSGDWSEITLDSISFVGSVIENWIDRTVIDNDTAVTIVASKTGDEPFVPAGVGVLATFHFTLSQSTLYGFYPIEVTTPDPLFTYDCGAGPVQVVPGGIDGGIVVGSADNYVCGYVVDPQGHQIEGATVELWADFPHGAWDDQTMTDATGLFQFFNSQVIPFDLWAYKDGYYPGKVENLNFGQSGIMIVLTPVEEFARTDEWVNFYCANNTYMGSPLPVGSVIDAYDPDGVHCGSQMVTEAGSYGFMPVYHDDMYSLEDEGAMPGDAIRFYVNGVLAYTPDDPIWTENGDAIEVCFHMGDIYVKECQLTEGWNLVSWNLDTESDAVADVLSSISDCLDVVLGFENGGLTYDPAMPLFSTLQYADHLSGYWIKVNCDITLQIVGEAVPNVTVIPLNVGWNLVSYLPDDAMATGDALASIMEDLDVAMGFDNGGLNYVPGDDLHNTLVEMSPCFGYWIKTSYPSELLYPGIGPEISPQLNFDRFAAKVVGGVNMTPTWVNLYAEKLTLDGEVVPAGASVTAHTADGRMVGHFELQSDGLFGFMPVYGDDPSTETVDGAEEGQTFTLKVDGVETNEEFTWTAIGDRIAVSALTAKGTSDDMVPGSYSLRQNYPNPFNPSTTIGFSLPNSGQARIEVYNILGRCVAVPFEGIADAGYNEVTWDGRNNTGAPVASGIYFYRLVSDNYTETRKMMLLK
ncbi:MAG TPA: T9SS type A sorting domain-containing protein [candidate division Zixibacteria bacterium]|nr:T9SS type A sorting domain-containing protein [candidate division Zixibacteria bacterium]